MRALRSDAGSLVRACTLAILLVGGPALAQETSPAGVRVDVSRELRRAEAALEQSVRFDYVETSLAEVLNDLERQIHSPIQIASESDDLPPNWLDEAQITAAAQDVPCGAAAPLLFGGVDLTVDVRAHGVVLVSNDDVQQYLRSYHVREIVQAWAAEQKPLAYRGRRVPGFSDPVRRPGDDTPLGAILLPERPEDGLLELVTTTIEPDTWDYNGGEGALAYSPAGGLLVVDQVYTVHREIEHLLNVLLAAIRAPAAPAAGGR